jgi:alpha-tubulin suppressor-like RCC1 family protein
VRGLSAVLAASAGSDFSLVINPDNTVSAWGNNSYGQLGTPARNVMIPYPKRIPGLTDIVAISAGSMHGLALDSNGQIWAWGANEYQQLGTGAKSYISAPMRVLGLPNPADGARSIRAIVAGKQNSAVVYADGTVWIWGSNLSGQFGNGNVSSSATPVQMNGATGVAALAIGNGFVSILNAGGSAFSAGNNHKGQLGNNTTTGATVPVQVTGRSGVGVLDLGKSAAK